MKKIVLWFLLFSIAFCGFSNALFLDFININVQWLADRFSSVHFMGPGNDFGGAFFWLPSKSLPIPQEITLAGQTVTCYKQVRWIYYNSQRGQRLRPLDVYTLAMFREANSSYMGLDLLWGLYSTCDIDPYAIFGQISFELTGDFSYLMAWVEVDYSANWFTWDFKKNLQYFNNDFPLWYVVDSLWWIGFVGGLLTGDWTVSITGHECLTCLLNEDCSEFPYCEVSGCSWSEINNFFEYSGSEIMADEDCGFVITWVTVAGWPQRWIDIQWKIGLSWTLENIERQALLGTQDKAVLLSTPNVTSASLVNQSRKISRDLCRWRPNYTSNVLPTSDDVVLCFNYPTYHDANILTINLVEENKYKNKTIIVKNANVILENSMSSELDFLDIFVDNGNIILQNGTTNLQWFDGAGYLSTAWIGITKWLLLQWNLIINWLLLAQSWTLDSYEHKLYFHGKIHTLNTPVMPSEWRINQIFSLFGVSIFEPWINLQNIFSRYCNPTTGSGSDWVSCLNDPLAESPIVIIDKNFPSRLFSN